MSFYALFVMFFCFFILKGRMYVMKKVVEKRIVGMLLAMAMIFGFAAYQPKLDLTADASAKDTTSGFYVDGTKIYDANGQEFIMRGINHAHVWFVDESKTAIPAIADTGSNCIRLVLSNGKAGSLGTGWDNPATTASEMEELIKMSIDNNMVPIVEIHDATGNDSMDALQTCVDYWTQSDVKSVLQKYEKYVIVNIANEWYGTWDNGSKWAEGYKSAILQLREAGINNLLMVDVAGWGQAPLRCTGHSQSVFNADPNANTMFSIHMYDTAGANNSSVKNGIDGFLNNGVPVVVGEFANDHFGNYVAADYIMQYCQQKGVGYLGWSWKGNNEQLLSLDIADDWAGSSYSTWGNKLVNGTNGIKNTSKIASIFDDEDDSSSKAESSSKIDSSSKVESSSKADSSSAAENETVIAQTAISDFGWNNNNVLAFNLTGYDSAKIVATGNCSYIKFGVGGEVAWTELVDAASTNSNGVYTYEFSASEIAKFSANCELYIQGQDGTLDKVSVIGYNKVEESSSVAESSSKIESSSKAESSSSKSDSSSHKDSSSYSDFSSEIEIGDDYILDKDIVKHQLKDNGDTIRFVMIADEKKVLASKSGEVEVRVMDMNDIDMDPIVIKANVTTVYKTIYAGGQRVKAPDGKLFIISPEASGVSQIGWGALGLFKVDTFYPPRYASLYQNGFFGE